MSQIAYSLSGNSKYTVAFRWIPEDCVIETQTTISHSISFCCMCLPGHYTHTELFNGPLSGTTRVIQKQKKHSPTHTHEEEGFTQTARSIVWELVPFMPFTCPKFYLHHWFVARCLTLSFVSHSMGIQSHVICIVMTILHT